MTVHNDKNTTKSDHWFKSIQFKFKSVLSLFRPFWSVAEGEKFEQWKGNLADREINLYPIWNVASMFPILYCMSFLVQKNGMALFWGHFAITDFFSRLFYVKRLSMLPQTMPATWLLRPSRTVHLIYLFINVFTY